MKKTLSIQINLFGELVVCNPDGTEVSGQLKSDLLDCVKPGDAEDACRYILKTYNVEFWILRTINCEFINGLASEEEKTQCCRAIYPDSDTDFFDSDNCNLYLIWEAANTVKR